MNVFDVRDRFQGPVKARRARTAFIVVHHAAALYRTATGIEDVQAVHNYHRGKWPDFGAIGYHWVVAEERNGGAVGLYQCSDPMLQRAHILNRNHECFGICCATNFDSHPFGVPEPKWRDALDAAVRLARELFPDAEVVGHQDIAVPEGKTNCPGMRWGDWRESFLAPFRPAAVPMTIYTPDSPLVAMPPANASAKRIAEHISAQPTGTYTPADVRLIVDAYFMHGVACDIDPVLAIAQMLHETGNLTSFWSQRPQRNPAGIGVTGDWSPVPRPGFIYNTQRRRYEQGLTFAAWDTSAIPVHLGRLLTYALPPDAPLTARQAAFIARSQAIRPLPPHYRGCAPTLQGLEGTWAVPGEHYAEALASRAMILAGA